MRTLMIAIIILTAFMCARMVYAVTVVKIEADAQGRVFDGIGMVNSSGTSKLLFDYPLAQQKDILDLLFKPNFGAGFTIIKNEIGSDSNTSSGTEPSHQRLETDAVTIRGVNFRICSEAKKINPAIKFAAGRWGIPFWASLSDDAKKQYYIGYAKAMAQNNTPLSYLSPDENEGSFNRDWAVDILKPALVAAGYSGVSLVAQDGLNWDIADAVQSDPDLKKSLFAINCHYTTESTKAAQDCGLPLFNDESDTPMLDDWKRLMLVAENMAKQYVDGKMTRVMFQPGLDCVYDSIKYNGKGVLTANTPWSGHYTIHPSLWMCAQFTQFAKPGWKFLDSACGNPAGGAYYITLKDPDSGNYSVIIINNSDEAMDYDFDVSAGMAGGKVHVWSTAQKQQFVKQKDIKPLHGKFSISIPAQSIYSLTTTTGQHKGGPAGKIPEDTAPALPYTDDFSGYEAGKQPGYFYDQAGAFEAADIDGKKCLEQVITVPPVEWWGRQSKRDPYTVMGDMRWANYQLSADVMIGSSGYALISGRGILHDRDSGTSPSGYQLKLSANGTWVFRKNDYGIITDFDSGTLGGFDPGKWHNLKICMDGNSITAYIDNTQTASVQDKTFGYGQAALGSGYSEVLFKNLKVEKTGKDTPAICAIVDDKDASIKYSGEWAEEDGSWMDYRRGAHKSSKAGAEMNFSFTGTGIIISGRMAQNCGMADVYVDNVKQWTINCYNDKNIYRAALFQAYGLAPGAHTVRVLVTGNKDIKAGDSLIYIDSIEYEGQ